MTFSGYLKDFSLPEIFQFLEQGQKKGLLTIRALPAVQNQEVQVYYIWLLQGRIVAAADRLDGEGLISMIIQRRWVSDQITSEISLICPDNKPMGLCLKSQGLLQAEQLTLLFRTQVLGQVSALFQLRDGQYEFDPKASLPLTEITGLSMPATEVTLMGLRTLRDWTALAEKLPESTSGLSSMIAGKPQLQLDSLEWQIWEFVNGTVSLQAIANQLRLSVEKVQQIAFRLIVINLAEEVPMIATTLTCAVVESTPVADNVPELVAASSSRTNVSQSFLQNLVGFLRSKA